MNNISQKSIITDYNGSYWHKKHKGYNSFSMDYNSYMNYNPLKMNYNFNGL